MFKKILIANRGEIACRIIKTARNMGIETVAVYSTADKNSLHVTLADEAFCIGEPAAIASYLNIEAIIAVATQAKVEAIHPGYGFLSENSDFVRACNKAGIIFIGPGEQAMEAMGSKQLAKQMLENTAVPLTPGYHGTRQDDEYLLAEAKRLGFPVLLKAAAGGGGKGMRAVFDETNFFDALAGARREATAGFADDTMLIEKLIRNPRHVEIQIMADNHGNIVHLFERDCSMQRRHQKIIEEAPAPNLSEALRQGLANAAITVARTIDYRGAGTVEFLVENNECFYFMEMNTRLQVEHPVTELITGLDLVEWQLRIAANEPLPCRQEEINLQGHAIECRIYAEDPAHGFLPSIGQIRLLKEPSSPGIRIDSGVIAGSMITRYYDPMIAKLIACGDNRHEALQRLQQALQHYHIGGVKTNIAFLQAITKHRQFTEAMLSTDFLERETIELPLGDNRLAIYLAASVDYLRIVPTDKTGLQADTFAWQMHLPSEWRWRYRIQDELYEVTISPKSLEQFVLKLNNKTTRELQASWCNGQLRLSDGKETWMVWLEELAPQMIFYLETGPITVDRFNWDTASADTSHSKAQLTAPMPGTIVAILKNKGDKIKAGERLIVLEAMKMEHTIQAPADGRVVEIFYDIGAQVNEGAELVAMEALD
ncbi:MULTISPECIES: acetyl/propionyl/methylcrotonyl-CoA carboxylase subunit alpha [Legionella]|uniref:Biotin carboxylase n=1 Tax=Legionella septentrionalis TaxID=2498109 RepID=A0A3S0XGZ5_9GAMM|nr:MULTISPECIES: acetyl-CoA carboxylase biotin carboxylase subunit [Legionella]MCP0914208.1 acetyl-CoA carboxylase biotin carboxylase subunit [Legionella sp. 27cVA30]RUQ89216.1 acetyl-CoA carboxylase biotin carboxylase subunit [Legionella septentrionalis]RUR00549.1 acetyl-CoA carboxylase biotin carboxylase subunit [Legionella septentrionalis]